MLVLTGCGNKVSLKGRVVYSDDQSPVPAGSVCFETDTYVARGTLKPDGTFVVGSLRENDGLPTGTYRVYIVGAEKVIGHTGDGMELFEPLIDNKYTKSSTSEITIDLTRSTKDFLITVDRYQPEKRR